MSHTINPITGRKIRVDGEVARKLIADKIMVWTQEGLVPSPSPSPSRITVDSSAPPKSSSPKLNSKQNKVWDAIEGKSPLDASNIIMTMLQKYKPYKEIEELLDDGRLNKSILNARIELILRLLADMYIKKTKTKTETVDIAEQETMARLCIKMIRNGLDVNMRLHPLLNRSLVWLLYAIVRKVNPDFQGPWIDVLYVALDSHPEKRTLLLGDGNDAITLTMLEKDGAPKELIERFGFAVEPILVPKKIKSQLVLAAQKAKQRTNIRKGNAYISEAHKKACMSKNFDELNIQIIKHNIYYPIAKFLFNISFLDQPDTPWIITDRRYENVNDLSVSTNNIIQELTKGLEINNSVDNLDLEWIHAQNDWIRSLPRDDLLTLLGSCEHSHLWVNLYLRQAWNIYTYQQELKTFFLLKPNHYIPLYIQMRNLIIQKEPKVSDFYWNNKFTMRGKRMTCLEWGKHIHDNHRSMKQSDVYEVIRMMCLYFSEPFVRNAFDMFIEDLQRIIGTAPPIKQTMYLYRGTEKDIFDGKPGAIYTNPAFTSSSFDAARAMIYTERTLGKCCFQKIKVLPGVRCALIAGINPWGEKEILLNKDCTYKIEKRNVYRYDLLNSAETICLTEKDPPRIMTSEITISPTDT